MPIFDTSALLPLFLRGHPRREEARANAEKESLWHVPAGVVHELTSVVRRLSNANKVDGNAAGRATLRILQANPAYRYLIEHDADFVGSIYESHAGLSYVDAWGIAVALDRVEPLVTFDTRQAQVYARLQ